MTDTSISRTLIPENQRIDFTAKLFGNHFPLQLEPFIYFMADTMSEDYLGGYWEFYALGNGGFYMAPSGDKRFRVSCENGFNGSLSADAFGVVCCMYAYSHLSFGTPTPFTETCAEHYHLLREYMYEHPEARAILQAID